MNKKMEFVIHEAELLREGIILLIYLIARAIGSLIVRPPEKLDPGRVRPRKS
jgi:hypothetical protein